MADVQDKTVPYEILVRFGEDGQVQGAHFIKRRLLTINGELLKDEVGVAQPVSLAKQTDGDTLESVMGQALTSALATIGVLQDEIQKKDHELLAVNEALKAAAEERKD